MYIHYTTYKLRIVYFIIYTQFNVYIYIYMNVFTYLYVYKYIHYIVCVNIYIYTSFQIIYMRIIYTLYHIISYCTYIYIYMYIYTYIYPIGSLIHFRKLSTSPSDRSCMEKQIPNRIASSEAVPSSHLLLLLTAWHSVTTP